MSDLEIVAAQTGQVFYQGRLFERERIIKLLEDNNSCDGGLSSGNCTCAAIALIKGDK